MNMSKQFCCITSKEGYEQAKKEGYIGNFHYCPTDQTRRATLKWYDTELVFALWSDGSFVIESLMPRNLFTVRGRVADKDHYIIKEAVIGDRHEKADRFLNKYKKIMAMGHCVAVYEYGEAC